MWYCYFTALLTAPRECAQLGSYSPPGDPYGESAGTPLPASAVAATAAGSCEWWHVLPSEREAARMFTALVDSKADAKVQDITKRDFSTIVFRTCNAVHRTHRRGHGWRSPTTGLCALCTAYLMGECYRSLGRRRARRASQLLDAARARDMVAAVTSDTAGGNKEATSTGSPGGMRRSGSRRNTMPAHRMLQDLQSLRNVKGSGTGNSSGVHATGASASRTRTRAHRRR